MRCSISENDHYIQVSDAQIAGGGNMLLINQLSGALARVNSQCNMIDYYIFIIN